MWERMKRPLLHACIKQPGPSGACRLLTQISIVFLEEKAQTRPSWRRSLTSSYRSHLTALNAFCRKQSHASMGRKQNKTNKKHENSHKSFPVSERESQLLWGGAKLARVARGRVPWSLRVIGLDPWQSSRRTPCDKKVTLAYQQELARQLAPAHPAGRARGGWSLARCPQNCINHRRTPAERPGARGFLREASVHSMNRGHCEAPPGPEEPG